MPDILVGRDHHVDGCRFRSFQKLPVFKLCGPPISTTVRTSCLSKKRRTPTGTFLSKRTRNAMTLGVGQNCLDTILGHFELFRYFGHTHAVAGVVDNRVHRHPRAAQHWNPALHARIYLHQGHCDQSICSSAAMRSLSDTLISCLRPKRQKRLAVPVRTGIRLEPMPPRYAVGQASNRPRSRAFGPYTEHRGPMYN